VVREVHWIVANPMDEAIRGAGDTRRYDGRAPARVEVLHAVPQQAAHDNHLRLRVLDDAQVWCRRVSVGLQVRLNAVADVRGAA
jgi:hypothetical protein